MWLLENGFVIGRQRICFLDCMCLCSVVSPDDLPLNWNGLSRIGNV